jgi:hypothetical protein
MLVFARIFSTFGANWFVLCLSQHASYATYLSCSFGQYKLVHFTARQIQYSSGEAAGTAFYLLQLWKSKKSANPPGMNYSPLLAKTYGK